MTVGILGPLEVTAGETRIPLGARGRRAVLALLALQPGRVVPVGSMLDALWGDDPPASAENLVQGYVSKLRALLGAESIVTQAPGYRLDGIDVDTVTFTALVEQAHAAPAAEAARLLEEALGLWRGDFLADLSDLEPVREAAPRWAEERLAAEVALARTCLALGRAEHVLPRLEALTDAHPYREDAQALLVDALHRGGRRTEALRAAHRARERLAEAGLDPGATLTAAERRALDGADHEPAPVHEPASLPRPMSSFIGRAVDIEAVTAAVRDARVVTLVGPGGTGKTRLALRAASERRATFVDLARISDARGVIQAAAATLGVVEGSDEIDVALRRWAASQRDHLVIVDNCEHLVEGAAALVTLLGAAGPGVRVLATSRERLGVEGERVWAVPPLDEADAAELFLTRLRALDPQADPAAELVARLCEELDRLPLAIELAAARAASLGAEEVLDRLGDRLRLLATTRNRDGRQNSLQAVVDWSHDLLEEPERILFRRMSVFAGPFRLESAEHVCGGEPLTGPEIGELTARLVEKSLVRREAPRFRLLETIRHYGRDRLREAGEEDLVRSAHVDWALEVCFDPRSAIARVVDDDLRAALDWCAARGDARGYALGLRASELAETLGRGSEAQSRASVAADLATNPADRAGALLRVGQIAWGRWRGDAAIDAHRRAASAFREAGDEMAAIAAGAAMVEVSTRFGATVAEHLTRPERDAALADGLTADLPPAVAAKVWTAHAFSLRVDNGPAGAAAHHALELARRSDDPLALSGAIDAVEAVLLDEGRFGDSIRFVTERIGLLDRLPADRTGEREIADIMTMATDCFSRAGDFGQAAIYAERLAQLDSEQGAPGEGLERLVTTRFWTGDWDGCLEAGERMTSSWQCSGRPPAGFLAEALACLASVHTLRGDAAAAAELWQMADELMCQAPQPYRAVFVATCRADIALAEGRAGDALATLDAMPLTGWYRTMASAVRAEAAVAAGDPRAAALVEQAAVLAHDDAYARAVLLRASGRPEDAIRAFEELPCPYQAARTGMALGGPPRAAARRVYRSLGLGP